MTAKHLKAFTFLILTSAIWGFASPIIKFTLEGIDPGPFLAYRFFISSIFAIGFFAINRTERKIFTGKHIVSTSVYSLFSTTLALGALFWGLDRVTVLESNIVTSIIPLLIVVAGALVFKEKVPGQEKFGAFIAFLGTCVAIILPVIEGYEDRSHWLGTVFILAYMASDIVSALMAKGLLKKRVSAAGMTNFSFIFGFITIVPFALIDVSPVQVIDHIVHMPLHYHLGVWYMALMSGTMGYYLRNSAQKYVNVGDAGLFAYLIPIFSAPLAVLWLGEKLTMPLVLGSILIITGVVISETRGISRKRFNLHLPHLLSKK